MGIRPCGVRRASACVLLLASAPFAAPGAQQWNDERALALVRQATALRARQLADSGLLDYRATAHGYVTFLAQLGEGFREPPQVVKADELALEVYWRAPNLSKQRIVGRRDTTLLPTDIQYHRDHLGIVQNNFPAIIRLGDGDEVQDVPHPLSSVGLLEYDFTLTDSLRISMPGRTIGVYEVKVRPKDDRKPRVIGALYLDRDNAQVVRMALSFTRAAFLDKQLEDLFIVLENGLVGARFWLPRRQEIEIRRSATWLDYPVRGIIRGRWEIGEYQVNAGLLREFFVGPEIVDAPRLVQQRHPWPSAHILDSLPPDVRAVTAEEIRRVQIEARALVREQALRRARTSALAARGVSDFVRYNRVEGVALGAGLSWRLGGGFALTARGRYGMEDHSEKVRVEGSWQNARGTIIRLYGADDFRDAGDVAERSMLVNSLAAQEFGSDHTNPYGTKLVGAGLSVMLRQSRVTLDAAHETQAALTVRTAPARGAFEETVPAGALRGSRYAVRVDRPTTLGWLGFESRGGVEVRLTRTDGVIQTDCEVEGGFACDETSVLRGAFNLELERPVRQARVLARTIGGIASASDYLPAQELVFLGGTVSAPGYAYHELIGDRVLSQRVELQLPIPFPAVPLGRFGRSPARATFAPHVTGVLLRQVPSSTPLATRQLSAISPTPSDLLRPRESGFYPAVGASVITAFDLLRLDLSRGLRDGRWTFSLDINRTFWSIL